MRTLGLIGGMSWQSSRLYYDRINSRVAERLGPEHSAALILYSLDFAPIARMQAEGRWREAGACLASAAQGLERAGADVIAICANTMHKLAEEVRASVSIPLLHIGDALGARLRREGRTRPLLLGTRYTMEDTFLSGHLVRDGVVTITPDPEQRSRLHAIIYEELIRGVVRPESRAELQMMIARAAERAADSVILGCTELGMLLGPGEAGLPAYDTLEIHAEALVDAALS